MIKLKLSFGNDKPPVEIEIVEGELLVEAVARATADVPLNGLAQDEVFSAVVNGNIIEGDLWLFTALKTTDTVLITPSLNSGDSGQLIKQALIITAIAVLSVYLGPEVVSAYGPLAGALAVGAASFGATLLLNALIPPPVPNGDTSGSSPISASQMYAINGQSNTVKRFGYVPKVYGTFRMFPNVAANPYTELVSDFDLLTGLPQVIQYLYVVYDFGFGPMMAKDFKVGDTALTSTSFNNYEMRLVDFNQPAGSSYAWDQRFDTLAVYKGDFSGDAVGVALNGNQFTGDPIDNWQAIRNTAINLDGVSQEIILNFANPSGLYCFDAFGNEAQVQINLDISFALIGTDVWYKYNDLRYVESYQAVGGEADVFDIFPSLAPAVEGHADSDYYIGWPDSGTQSNVAGDIHTDYRMRMQIKPGTNKVLIYNHTGLTVGMTVFYSYSPLGVITSITDYAGNPGVVSVLTLDTHFTLGEFFFEYSGTAPVAQPRTVPFDRDPVVPPTITWNDASVVAYPIAYLRVDGHSLGRGTIQREDQRQVFSSFRFTPKVQGQFQVKVQRIDTSNAYTTTVQSELTWETVTTRFDRQPIITDKRHLFAELKIKATDQLNGTIQNLSAVCTSVLDVYDPITMTWTPKPTNNPAWVFCDLLTGEVNKSPVDKSRLDMDSIVAWADFCDEVPDAPAGSTFNFPRFQCNFVLDYNATLASVIAQVTGAAQASMNIIDGKYGVLIDNFKSTPVQIFTPRNSKDFSSVRAYTPQPDGLNVTYIEPGQGWNATQLLVPDDGFDLVTAIATEDITSFGCTNNEQAHRFGRYTIAQNRLRQETISINVDFENLVCTRGDYVVITQDVMKVGGFPCRVKTLVGSTITVDDNFDLDPMASYGYTYRSPLGGQIKTSTLTVVTDNSFTLAGDLPAVGDLIIIGEVGFITFDCIVKSITPNDDMSAQITLIEKADGIFTAESSGVIPDYSPLISPTSLEVRPPIAVENLALADNSYTCNSSGTGYDYLIDITWDIPPGCIFELFSVMLKVSGVTYTEVGTTRKTAFQYTVGPDDLDLLHSFKVIAVSANGKKLELAAVPTITATPVEKSARPSDVAYLNSDITNEVIQLSWPQIADCDVREYRVKFTPDLTGTWETALPLLKVDRRVNLASAQARTGLYFIKAVDFGGRESLNAAEALTTIPRLFNLNVIEEIDESPTWVGGYDRTQLLVDAVGLDYATVGPVGTRVFYPEGYYYFNEVIDLGDSYTSRIQSQIQAIGLADGDLMSLWDELSDVTELDNTASGDWNVESQYRVSNTRNVMEDWTELSTITAINQGLEDNYTPWRTFTMGDATGRIYQFRLKLTTAVPTITPRVFDGSIRVDMPDRVESYENLTSDATVGYTVTYAEAFKGPGTSPNIQVCIDGASTGDYWAFVSKDLTGFTIRFFDKNGTGVARQFDVAVKGYGRQHDAAI